MAQTWRIIIEENKPSTTQGVHLTIHPATFHHEWEAENEAKRLAEEYKPGSLMTHRERTILRRGKGEYKVLVQGMVGNTHFQVTVYEVVSGAPTGSHFANKALR
ncbi:hypothetical protein [Natronoglycomyces albus]|uniref:Uncharacterized protein n=1 Tax=Natronoglycomyces albus TaxID=2811108 RepID=A0A895XPJ7_9ACTN|nr:hypothetical protein [Natronoglycomyces albus]QSB05015.1 hypothetical protein JQS30_14805 [Natronoglycomyces albus]